MSNKYEDLIKNARMNADCGEHMSPAEVTTLLNVVETTLSALAEENAGLKAKGREVLKEAAYVYSHYNRMVDHLDGESVDGQTLHEFQFVLDCETPATDAFMAEVRAQGVEMFAIEWGGHDSPYGQDAYNFADKIRKGVQS